MVGEGQERRPARAAGQQQLGGGDRVPRPRHLRRRPARAEGRPSRRDALLPLGQPIVEAGGQDDLRLPGLARLPAGLGQQIGGRGQGVGRRAPDVPLAVSVPVHGGGQEGLGFELGLTHGAGPGALELGAAGLAGGDDLDQGGDLGLRPSPPSALCGKGGQGAQDVEVAHDRAEAGFHGPDADQDLGGNTVLAGDRR